MSYKILTKNGIDNSNIDGARGEYFNTGMRDGIVQGVLNEGTFVASSSNVISLDTCELRICGHRVVIDEPVYHTFTNAPSTDTRYAFVAQIVVDDNQNVDFSLFVQTASTPLIQNDLYKNITGAGTYQVEIGSFTLLTTLTIEDVVRTIEVITGGTEKDNCPVIELVGTEDNPINFGAMELGKLYICTGVYNTQMLSGGVGNLAGKTVTFSATQPLLVFKRTVTNVTIFNAIARLNNDTNIVIGQYPYGVVNIATAGREGLIVGVWNGIILQEINGDANGWVNFEDVEAGIYVPTTSGTSGQILQSNGENAAPTWIDAPSGDSPMETLIGTTENPINFATSMETGKLYSCKGVFSLTNVITDTNSLAYNLPIQMGSATYAYSYLIYKANDGQIVILNCNISPVTQNGETTRVNISSSYYAHVRMKFNSKGEITACDQGMMLQNINGKLINSSVQRNGIYVAETAGTVGQILQANGEGQAPTWLTPSSTISNLSTASEIPNAQAVFNYVDDVVGDIETALSEV